MNETHPNNNSLEIRISANPAYLCIVRTVSKMMGKLSGLAEADIDSVVLAIEEAMTNVIRHGYGGPCTRPIVVRMEILTGQADGVDKLEITIRDFGKQVDPDCIKGRNLDDVKPGGLGVHLIKSVMDEAEYSCHEEVGMQLRMSKRIEIPEPEQREE
jgi:anti-sigma regulatory factor (Ser/Thr protein kinase)